jgi:hypothetical protein
MHALHPFAEPVGDLFETANLSPTITGLPMAVWISERDGAGHGARVKVSLARGRRTRPDITASVSVRPHVRLVAGQPLDVADMAPVRRWIEPSRDTPVAYWDGDLLTDEAVARLRPIGVWVSFVSWAPLSG